MNLCNINKVHIEVHIILKIDIDHIIKSPVLMYQVFEDGLDPDSLFDRLKEETVAEKKSVVKTPKTRKVSSKSIISQQQINYFSAAC